MLDTLKIFNEFKEKLDPDVALKLAETFGTLYGELANTVTKTDFNELKSVVQELVEAQKRTEQRVKELAKAQERTEKRLNSLTIKVEELAQAQKRTEERLEELVRAHLHLEKRVDKLDRDVSDLKKQVGGISNTLGYLLENRSYGTLKKILDERFEIKVSKLFRRNIVYDSKNFDEINIYGEGLKDNRKIYVIGESKSQFGLKDVQKFLKLLERVKKHLDADVFPLALAHQFHPRAEEKLKKLGIPAFWSYEVENN